MNQIETIQDLDPCRIIVIGLPYSGKSQVVRVLSQKHNCQMLKFDNIDLTKQQHKQVGKLCFNDYKGQAVLQLNSIHYKTFHYLKKRNFVNVVLVDTPFKKRFEFYCNKFKKQKSLELFQVFSNLDFEYQTQEYLNCLDFVRARIYNDKGIEQLELKIKQNLNQIIRPFRPNYDEYFMKMADIAKRRSNCMKSSVGCVIVNDSNRVVSTGFNGTPKGIKSCFLEGCKRCNDNIQRGLDQCLCLHGEESAILEVGISRTAGCKLYTTLYPCFSCAKIIKQAGIKKIYYMQEYKKEDNGERFLKQNYKNEDVVQIKVNNIYY